MPLIQTRFSELFRSRANRSGLILDRVDNLDRVGLKQRLKVNSQGKWMQFVVASNSDNRRRRILLAVTSESKLRHF